MLIYDTGVYATTRGWRVVMMITDRAHMGANAATKGDRDELLWVNDDVDSLKPQYWVAYNEE